MALFAKRLECWASEISYSAIIVIAKKKGGDPTSYIIYACEAKGEDCRFVMRSFFSHEEAKKYVASKHGEDFHVTSPWLNHVATGFHGDGWMRVPTPRIGPRKRGKRPPLFGDLGFFYRTAKAEEAEANERMKAIEKELDELVEEYGLEDARTLHSFKQLEAEKESVAEAWYNAYDRWAGVRCELEFVRSKNTGIPIKPGSLSQLLLAEAQRRS